jgi:hypothetical protein
MTQDPHPAICPCRTREARHTHAPALRQDYAMGQALDPVAQQPADADDTLDLRDLWRMVMKHKALIVGMTTFGLLAALLVSFVRTPLYLASTTLQVDKRAAQVVQFNKDDALGSNQEGGDERTAMGTYLELLKSRVLAERVIDELQLDRMALPDQENDQLTTPKRPGRRCRCQRGPAPARAGRPCLSKHGRKFKTATARCAAPRPPTPTR